MDTEVIPAAEPSISDLRAMVKGEAPAAPAADAAAQPAEPARTEPASEPDAAQATKESDRGQDGKFKAKAETPEPDENLPPNVQKRIAKAVKAQREAERRAAELETRLNGNQESRPANQNAPAARQESSQPAQAPESKNFDSYEAYVKALTEWTIDQRDVQKATAARESDAQDRQRILNDSHAARIIEAAKAPDWDEVIEAAAKMPCSREVDHAIRESDKGPEIVRYLVKAPAEAERIAKLSPTRQIAEIGKIEALLTQTKPATPAKKDLPKPPANVGGSASAKEDDINDPDLDFGTFKRLMRSSLS